MAEEVSRKTQSKLIEKLSSLPAGAFRMRPYSCSEINANESSYCFYDSKSNQLFSVVSSCWTDYSHNMVGETESEHGVNYYLRVYDGRSLKDEPIFEFSSEKVKKLYYTIEDKLRKAERENEKRKNDRNLKKLKQFAGG